MHLPHPGQAKDLIAGTACLLAVSLLAAPVVPAYASTDCFETLAQTRSYTLGLPRHVVPLNDGSHVLYLRSGPRDTHLRLYEFDISTKAEHELAAPSGEPEHLSAEEKARRERARMTMSGIADFAVSDDASQVLVSQADTLSIVSLPPSTQVGRQAGTQVPLPGRGWIAPRLAPDGRAIAVVRDHDVHIIDRTTGHDTQITHGGTETLTHGLAEFAAAEELERADGIWWSPDSQKLLIEEADSAGVEQHYIAHPAHPDVAPTSFRYPRAGTANARTRFGLIARAGGAITWLPIDQAAWPYVARVVWPKNGPLSLVVLNRAQTSEALLAVDPSSGTVRTLLTESDPAWLDLTPRDEAPGRKLPAWLPDGSGFLWAAERGPTWQLELRHADGSLDHAITPPGWPFVALGDVDQAANRITVTGSPDRLSLGLFSVPFAGGQPAALAASAGLHIAVFPEDSHAFFADTQNLADGTRGTMLRQADGTPIATLPSRAESPASLPDITYLAAGPQALDAQIIRPHGFDRRKTYPVILAVYAGPTVKVVERAKLNSLEDQCLADRGFIVVSLDARGTPGRDHDFERATHHNLIDLPLADQIEGLQALARQFPQLDMRRVGVEGWSFGGYFTAMATIRRPDIFAAGAAGAPVVDFGDYDTAYTERYLGTPQDDEEGYRRSNVLTYAPGLTRPLLIMHGLTDDNVYFENTVKLTQSLLAAGKPYQLLLLPGTHLLPDPLIRARVDQARARFLSESLAIR